ncbi:ATP-grasp domain-containing protein [Paenibacillus sp. GCM10012307]|uniref:ATP-grasp domain-containing protein n=1 Tax=Paenibacillus roseus TaxID=2798579 RepID=A0A934J735_9BACL|nr:ATP-grasp domain-containing protein [Paenibacillus roseus]MBJ6362838.1 ATP-grasp domain-containing protein [Paenibacillus roseus]
MSKHIVFVEMSMTGAGEKAIQYALEQGYQVTLVAKDPKRYASANIGSTALFVCDTNDLDALGKGIKELHEAKAIEGITTTADFYVPQASYAAEILGLISIPYKDARSARNKYLMRLRLQESCPHLNPAFALVQSIEEARHFAERHGYPLIAKPQDGNDSLNVNLINDEQELADYIKESQAWAVNSSGQRYAEGVLLEQFIEGEEYSVETVQHKKQAIQCIGVTGKVLTGVDRGFFVEEGVFFPVRTEQTEHLFQEVSLALKELNIDCGVIHTECRVHNGAVKILEINPRLMGDMAGSHMIELALGASPIQQVVEIALGNDEALWNPTKNKGAAMYGSLSPKTGVFGGIENLSAIQKIDGVHAVKVIASEGGHYQFPPKSNGDILLRLVTEAETPEEALEIAETAAKTAVFKFLAD